MSDPKELSPDSSTLLSPNSNQNPKLSFEGALEQLQIAVKKLESGELSLDQSLRQFEEGVRLTRFCQEHLAVAEQRVQLLLKPTPEGTPEVQPFSQDR